MKAGLITFHTARNYGAVLQAYALQQTILKTGADCEIIDYDCKKFRKDYALVRLTVHVRRCLCSILSIPITLKLRSQYTRFVSERLVCSAEKYTADNITECDGKYDVYFTGSDQVFDPYCAGFDSVYFLTFVSGNRVKASYAASLRKPEIPEQLQNEFIERIQGFDYISCREELGAELIHRLTGREAEVHVDPSILLNQSEWSRISQKPKTEKSYVFVYPVGHSKQMLQFAKNIAEKKGLEVVYLTYSKPWRDKSVKFVTGAGPEEFLGYIQNAKYVVTNSFHGTAFSLVFHKPFFSYCGEDGMGNTRVQTILSKVKMKDRIIGSHSIDMLEDNIDWKIFENWSDKEKRKTIAYLNEIVNSRR